jgi:hypothetical protein
MRLLSPDTGKNNAPCTTPISPISAVSPVDTLVKDKEHAFPAYTELDSIMLNVNKSRVERCCLIMRRPWNLLPKIRRNTLQQ